MMRMQRRKIGEGTFSKVARHGTNAVKFFSEQLSEKEFRQLRALHNSYVRLLEESGLNVVKTDFAKKSLLNGKFRLRLVQTAFEPDQLAKNRLRHGSAEEAKEIARMMVGATLDVFNFNRKVAIPKYGLVIAADLKPDNAAIVDNKLVYIDTFTPHLRSARDPSKINPVIDRYFKRQGLLLNLLAKRYVTRAIYDPKQRMIVLVSLMSKERPELKKSFLGIAREMAREKLPEKEANTIAKAMNSRNIFISRGIGKTIRFLGKRKGKNFQL